MNTVRLKTDNVFQYIGYEIIFKKHNCNVVKRIIGVSKTGKSIQIEHPNLQNNLQIESRNIFIIL